jgi:hypothetical protein
MVIAEWFRYSPFPNEGFYSASQHPLATIKLSPPQQDDPMAINSRHTETSRKPGLGKQTPHCPSELANMANIIIINK